MGKNTWVQWIERRLVSVAEKRRVTTRGITQRKGSDEVVYLQSVLYSSIQKT